MTGVLIMRNYMQQTIGKRIGTGYMFGQKLCFSDSSSKHPQKISNKGGTDNSESWQINKKQNIVARKKIIKFKKQSSVKVPIKMQLAMTNKMLFGPLLETSKKRMQRLKKAANDIDKAEVGNSHISVGDFLPEEVILSAFVDDKNLNRETIDSGSCSSVVEKIEDIEFDNLSIIDNNTERPMSYEKNNKSNAELNPRKTLNIKNPCIVDNIEGIQTIPDVNSKSTYHDRNISSYNLNLGQGVKSRSEEGKLQSFISIDTSTYSEVPEMLDLLEIENFPLYSDFGPREPTEPRYKDQGDEVISISIFDGGYKKIPSVRAILEKTMPESNKIALQKWKDKMIKNLGKDGFDQYQQELLRRGKFLHQCIQYELSGTSLNDEMTSSVKQLWQSIVPVVKNVSDVKVLESSLIHPYLYYQGAVDCVGTYRGVPILIEWKTALKPKTSLKSMFDDPLQVVAYLGAMNFDSNYRLHQPIQSAMLVVAYDSGLPAHVHCLTKEQCSYYWKIWRSRLIQFWKQQMPLPAALQE